MSTEENSTADSMSKATENLDHEAGAAPSAEYLNKVDTDEFGQTDETSNDADADEDADSDAD